MTDELGREVVEIVGVDMASDTADTAACVISHDDRGVRFGFTRPVDDTGIIDWLRNARLVAIDAPFGWPTPFIEFTARWCGEPGNRRNVPPWARLQYPNGDDVPWEELRELLKFRATDRFVRLRCRDEGDPYRFPVGSPVAADKIAVTTFRTIRLLDEASMTDLVGDSGRAIEVYPGPVLSLWRQGAGGYKGPRLSEKHETANYRQRCLIVDWLLQEIRAGLSSAANCSYDDESLVTLAEAMKKSDHVLDALVCALAGWAKLVGLTHDATAATLNRFWHSPHAVGRGRRLSELERRRMILDDRPPREIIQAEGWIHQPTAKPSAIVAQGFWDQ